MHTIKTSNINALSFNSLGLNSDVITAIDAIDSMYTGNAYESLAGKFETEDNTIINNRKDRDDQANIVE